MTKRPSALQMLVQGRAGDVLSDGAHVLRVSVQTDWVYVRVLRPDGRFVTRRYRHDAQVEVRET